MHVHSEISSLVAVVLNLNTPVFIPIIRLVLALSLHKGAIKTHDLFNN